MVEIPADVALEEVDESDFFWSQRVRQVVSQGNPGDVAAAARALCSARYPLIHAGQGALYARAYDELIELAELLQLPVMTTLLGKSAFPETHPLALGSGTGVMSGPVFHFVRRSDVIFGIGCSFTKHGMSMNLPPGKTLIHATNDPRDINKDYDVDYPIVGDAKLVLRQMIEACRDIVGDSRQGDTSIANEIRSERDAWLNNWAPQAQRARSPDKPIPRY